MSIEVSDEDVKAVETEVGLWTNCWGLMNPKELIAAAYEVMRKKDKHAAIGEAIERAAREFGYDWKLVISIKRGVVETVLHDPLGGRVLYSPNRGEHVAYQVESAIKHAKEMSDE